MGAGLTGLTIAYRLSRQGFRVSLIDQGTHNSSSQHSLSTKNLGTQDQFSLEHHNFSNLPIVVQGFQHATWSLLKELGVTSLLLNTPAVPFEFVMPSRTLLPFRPIVAPSPFHTLFSLLLFKGIPFSNRWALLKKVERYWEGDLEVPQNLDSQSVTDWLATHHQSMQACNDIWNPLCHFFLGTPSEDSSAQYFTMLLSRCFLSARSHHRTFIPALDEETLFLSPLRSCLTPQSINLHQGSTVSSLQCEGSHISSVHLEDGAALTADMYVSALPRRSFISCLPERLQAKFAYFSHLSQLEDLFLLTTNFELLNGIDKPRLLLFSDPCRWVAIRPYSDSSRQKTLISCVTLINQGLKDRYDYENFDNVWSLVSPLFPKSLSGLEPTNIGRAYHPFSASLTNKSPFRPLPKSPLTNLFVAGPWIDTGLPASRESSIVSANLCAQGILSHLMRN